MKIKKHLNGKIMDSYEQKYKEALERAKVIIKYYKEHNRGDEASIEDLEVIFPELLDEDERIRKELIKEINGLWENDSATWPSSLEKKNKYIAWLEKQGEQESDEWKEGNIIRHGDILALVIKGRRAMKSNGESFTVQYPSEWVKAAPTEIEHFLSKLEKQGEQKPANKVEPKFHEGDWITNGDYTWKIVEVKPLDYILQAQDGNIVDDTISHVDEQFHSFTIQDAKEGDVLVASDDSLFIFAKVKDNSAYYYFSLCTNGSKEISDGNHAWETASSCHPATKEHRELLFKKMHEAGYEWDDEKKELKLLITNGGDFEAENCEQNPADNDMVETLRTEYEKGRADAIAEMQVAWSEEDELVVEDIEEAVINYWHGQSQEDLLDWLKSLKNRVQPKQEWSDVDKDILFRTIDSLKFLKDTISTDPNYAVNIIDIEREITWLKSIRPQKKEALPQWRRLPLNSVSYAPDYWCVMDVITSTVGANSASVSALVKGDYYVPLFELEKFIRNI